MSEELRIFIEECIKNGLESKGYLVRYVSIDFRPGNEESGFVQGFGEIGIRATLK